MLSDPSLTSTTVQHTRQVSEVALFCPFRSKLEGPTAKLHCNSLLDLCLPHLMYVSVEVMPLSCLNADADETDWEAVVDDSNPPSFSQVDLARSEQEIQTHYPLFPVSSHGMTCSTILLCSRCTVSYTTVHEHCMLKPQFV